MHVFSPDGSHIGDVTERDVLTCVKDLAFIETNDPCIENLQACPINPASLTVLRGSCTNLLVLSTMYQGVAAFVAIEGELASSYFKAADRGHVARSEKGFIRFGYDLWQPRHQAVTQAKEPEEAVEAEDEAVEVVEVVEEAGVEVEEQVQEEAVEERQERRERKRKKRRAEAALQTIPELKATVRTVLFDAVLEKLTVLSRSHDTHDLVVLDNVLFAAASLLQ